MRYYLLSYHGRMLRRASNWSGAWQIEFQEIADRGELVCVELAPEVARGRYADFVQGAPGACAEAEIRHLGLRTIRTDPISKTLSIQSHDGFLSAQPSGDVHPDRQAVLEWERFVPCTDDDLDLLQFLRRNTWIIKSLRALVAPTEVTFGQGHRLFIGAHDVPLAYNLPFDTRTFPFKLTVLLDGWRIDEILLFDPMVFYVAFGAENVLAQLYASLQSLARAGRYGGEILVFTDRSQEEIRQAVPWFAPERISTAQLPAREWVGFVAAKYCIVEEPRAYRHQPILYMDPDIVFNTDVTPMLVDMALSERLSAPIEVGSALATHPPVGATLLQLDYEEPRFAAGFNGGTIGIPNLPLHRHTLLLIRRVIENFLAQHGRGALGFVDQEAANYVSYKLAHFDLRYVSRCVRFGNEDTAKVLGPLSGAVHFWAVDRARRAEIMLDYLNLVLDHEARNRSA